METQTQAYGEVINSIANSQKQQNILQQLKKFGDPELIAAYKDLFYWKGEEDSYADNVPGNKLYTWTEASAMFGDTGKDARKGITPGNADKYTLCEILRWHHVNAHTLESLIAENHPSYREALFFQIKRFAPGISPFALERLLTRALQHPEEIRKLTEHCLKYGRLSPKAEETLYRLGTPAQIRLYQNR